MGQIFPIGIFSDCTTISCKIDISAQCNVVPVETLNNIFPKSGLQPLNFKFAGQNESKVVCKCSLNLPHKNNFGLLSKMWTDNLQLIKEI